MMNINHLQALTTQVRRDILRMVHKVNSGHPGGSLGCSEFLVTLFNKIMKRNDNFSMDGIEEFVNQITEKEDAIDFLVNNAGAAWGEPLESFSEKGWDKVMDLNVKSIFFLTQKFKNLLSKNANDDDPSRVINIGSIDGLNVPSMETYPYGASKAAVHHLTRALASKLVRENILVNAIAPGPFPSMMLGSAVNHDYTGIAVRNPRKRVGTPEDMAGLAIFLCSRAGAYTVGETITSDGGIVKTANHDLS